LTTPEREALLGARPAEYVRLLNPISSERSAMRQSVLASVLDAAAANLRHTADVRFFEIGHVYIPRANAKLPDEPRRLAIVLCGKRASDYWGETDKAPAPLDFFDLKGVIEALVGDLHLPSPAYRRSSVPCLHPGKAAELLTDGRVVGSFGVLHPKMAEAFDMAGRQVLVGEFDLEALQAATPARHGYTSIPRFPAALRDVAVIVPEATPADQVEAEIKAGGGDLLRGVRLFDLYHGDSIAAGAKSLAYALTYQADDRTLTDKEVDRAHKKIQDRLRHVLKARIRGEDKE
jgi:phenylalanyl-tRNA synthetase beta chain